MSLRKISRQKELTGNNHRQTLFAEEITTKKNLEEVYTALIKDKEVQEQIEKIKGHK